MKSVPTLLPSRFLALIRRYADVDSAKFGTRMIARGSTLAILLGSVVTITGCASHPYRANCSDQCVDVCESDCLPKTIGQAAPGATIADWQRCVEKVPDEAVPVPAGTYLAAWREAQSAGAQQRHWVIPRNEWFSQGDQLSPDGLRHLDRVSATMAERPNWVVVETEPVQLERDETYDEALERIEQLQTRRRQVVVDRLVAAGIPDAEQWVIFAEDRNVGVRGIEAPQIFNRQFQTGGRGNRGGVGRGGFGGGLGGFGGGAGGLGGFGFGGGGFGGFGGFGGLGGGGIF